MIVTPILSAVNFSFIFQLRQQLELYSNPELADMIITTVLGEISEKFILPSLATKNAIV